eukprot:CAMPEP_0206164222 /NCGR_PEP_ID=MMETSP1474-20131121/15128_1 /ASSEMBLY_ACC=CAM_ASM_001110 /TAXON_ID=97495 /ORGANISM="Imantonia sp., Strain RCC918" /LENGTH=133 /DNA_ID=CAMNT_0053566999 /DNA_START=193 /DNA_END=591 /DNA_ORIENTATION=-
MIVLMSEVQLCDVLGNGPPPAQGGRRGPPTTPTECQAATSRPQSMIHPARRPRGDRGGPRGGPHGGPHGEPVDDVTECVYFEHRQHRVLQHAAAILDDLTPPLLSRRPDALAHRRREEAVVLGRPVELAQPRL